MLLHGQKEIEESAPVIRAIIGAHDLDTRLLHDNIKLVRNNAIVNAKSLGEDPRTTEVYQVPANGCGAPSCPFCYSAAEVTTIPDYASQRSVFL